MAKIIYKEGCEGQNKLSSIEGIEIELLNGQKALIYLKYAERRMLDPKQISNWDAAYKTEIEALKVKDTDENTIALFRIGSPAAKWALQFVTEKKTQFRLPSLLAALETQYQKKEIDALAETIKGADLLRDYTSITLSCSLCSNDNHCCWFANGSSGYAGYGNMSYSYLVVPTILYR